MRFVVLAPTSEASISGGNWPENQAELNGPRLFLGQFEVEDFIFRHQNFEIPTGAHCCGIHVAAGPGFPAIFHRRNGCNYKRTSVGSSPSSVLRLPLLSRSRVSQVPGSRWTSAQISVSSSKPQGHNISVHGRTGRTYWAHWWAASERGTICRCRCGK